MTRKERNCYLIFSLIAYPIRSVFDPLHQPISFQFPQDAAAVLGRHVLPINGETFKTRLKPICHRTLRRQVMRYIKYTQRLPIVEEYTMIGLLPHCRNN